MTAVVLLDFSCFFRVKLAQIFVGCHIVFRQTGVFPGLGIFQDQDVDGEQCHSDEENGGGTDGFCIAGTCVMAFGIIFESASDWQKSRAKAVNPKRFCDTGLFRIVRCPNYLGELIFWTGVLISGLNVLCGVGQWIMALLGYIGIVFVMFSGARRLELRQNKNYGDDPEYQAYVKSTPIMIPFVPLYSVVKYKFLVA